MAENKTKSGLPAFVGVAAVWMGTHFGPGVASGTQLNVYYVQYGIPGILVTLFAMAIIGYALYCSMEFSRIYKTYDYQSYVTKLFGMKWVVILFDISFLVTIITALGGSISAVATLLVNFYGFNYWAGVALVVACGTLICAFGADLVRRASSYMMFLVIGVLALVIGLIVIKGDGDLAGAIANQTTNLGEVNWLSVIWSAIIYACFQGTIVANITSVADTLPSRKESQKAAIFGWVLNSAVLVTLCLTLFSYTNVYDITSQSMPIYSMLERLGMDWLTMVYIAMVFVAVLSTVVGFAYGGVARFGKYFHSKEEGANHSKRDAIFVACMLLCCAAASKFGIVALVSTGYTLLGYLNLPIIILPAVLIGSRKISKKYLKANRITGTGLDLD